MTSRRNNRFSPQYQAALGQRIEASRRDSEDIREQALQKVLQDVAELTSRWVVGASAAALRMDDTGEAFDGAENPAGPELARQCAIRLLIDEAHADLRPSPPT